MDSTTNDGVSDGIMAKLLQKAEIRNQCSTCKENEGKYTCPACLRKSCSLKCVKQHKIDHSCCGQRNRVAYVSLNDFGDRHLLSDYHFLEDVARVADNSKRDPVIQTPRRNRRKMLTIFRNESRKLGINVKIMPEKFTKRSENTSFWHIKDKCILWHINWIFPLEQVDFTVDKIKDTLEVSSLLKKFIDPTEGDPMFLHRLKRYCTVNPQDIYVLLKNDCKQTHVSSYFILDKEKSLRENLVGKTVIEFPTLVVVLSNSLCQYLDNKNSDESSEDEETSSSSDCKSDSSESSDSESSATDDTGEEKNDSKTSKLVDFDSSDSDTSSSTDGDSSTDKVRDSKRLRLENESQAEELASNALQDSICIVHDINQRHLTKTTDTIKFVKDEDDTIEHSIIIPGSLDKKSALISELHTSNCNE